MPKDLNLKKLSKNLTIPSNINSLVERGEIGMLMFKLVEIIGSDDIENLDPETLYFIVNVLNKGKIKKVRNQILNLTLPLGYNYIINFYGYKENFNNSRPNT